VGLISKLLSYRTLIQKLPKRIGILLGAGGHACNPSYSGGLKQPRQIVQETLSQKKLPQKRSGGMAQRVGPEFKTPVPYTGTKDRDRVAAHSQVQGG
jgi:hypothetical protein